VELTTLVVPGHNDSDEELSRMAAWVVEHVGTDVPIHFSAFHPDWKMMDVAATPPATLSRARRIALEHGVHFAYTGNVHDPDGDTTFCPSCHHRVIERDWYEILSYDLDARGACTHCGTKIPGVFAAGPGTWGRRRLPVTLHR
jgi:pyruvate formate lyase activating enzyme